MDIANLRVVNEIEASGGTILSINSDPKVYPSIFFLDQSKKTNFVLVVPARYPDAPMLEDGVIENVKEKVSAYARSGFVAEVTLASVDDPFDRDAKINGNYLPLLRGAGYHQKFSGLDPL